MDSSELHGIDAASELARKGRFIFAIKLLERQNPGLSRADAKAAVDSLGYHERALRIAGADFPRRGLRWEAEI